MSRSSHKSPARLGAKEIANLVGRFFPSRGAEVIDLELRPFSSEALGYLGLHELLTVEAREKSGTNTTTKRLTFFVKSVLPTRNDFDVMIFAEEAKFFGDAAPRLLEDFKGEAWSAACYLVTDESIVLEDLGAEGFKLVEGPLSAGQLESSIACTARFHASSLLLEGKIKKSLRQVYPENFKEKTFKDNEYYTWKWLLAGIEVAERIAENMGLDPKYVLPAYKLIIETVKMVEGERNVLCHGDLWGKNLMFSEDERCRFVDFQMVVYTSYAVDLLEIIYLNTDGSTRGKLERDLIKLYHFVLSETLREHGYVEDKIVTLQEVFRDVEKKKICGLVIPVQFFPIALLNKELNSEYTRDGEILHDYMYKSRKDFVLRAMQLDDNYRQRLEECVKELIEYMQTREENSK